MTPEASSTSPRRHSAVEASWQSFFESKAGITATRSSEGFAMPKSAKPPYVVNQTLGFMILRAQRFMSQQLDAVFAGVGLSLAQHVALQLIDEQSANGPSDIAKTLCFDTGSATRLVDQLADKGLVVRKRISADRRQVSLALTAEGRAVSKAARAASAGYVKSLLTDFDAAEADALLDYLSRLVTRLEERANA
jgi:DNA-binding MarR family transcriptional regulator